MQECMEGQAGGVACGNRADTANGGTLLIMNAVFQWDHTSSLPPKDSRSGWSAKHQAPSTKHQAAGWGRGGRSVTVLTTPPDLGWSLALNTFSRHPQNKTNSKPNTTAACPPYLYCSQTDHIT